MPCFQGPLTYSRMGLTASRQFVLPASQTAISDGHLGPFLIGVEQGVWGATELKLHLSPAPTLQTLAVSRVFGKTIVLSDSYRPLTTGQSNE